MNKLIELGKSNKVTLATFKPANILDFNFEEQKQRDWDQKKLNKLKHKEAQLGLFQKELKQFEVVKKLPYNFSYTFLDENGNKSRMKIFDWEIGALFWNCLKNTGDEVSAKNKVIEKYKNNFLKNKDLYFFLGTTNSHQSVSKNPFTIIGVFYPPLDNQLKLF